MSAGTVQLNTAGTVFWFGVFPIAAAFALAYGYEGARRLWRAGWQRLDAKWDARIDAALRHPLTFDAGGHVHCCEAHCGHPSCVEWMTGARARIRARVDAELASRALPVETRQG